MLYSQFNRKVNRRWAAWMLCVLLGGVWLLGGCAAEEAAVWTEMDPKDYFPDDTTQAPEFIEDVCEFGVYGERFFSGKREELEEAGIIPALSQDYHFQCGASYDDDGQLKYLKLSWQLSTFLDWGHREDYLMVEYSPQEPLWSSQEQGKITEQMGMEVTGLRAKSGDRCLRFQKDGYYQIYGANYLPCEDTAAAAEHFLQHPIELEPFSKEKGDEYDWSTLEEYPDAFAGHYPTEEDGCAPLLFGEVRLRNDEPMELQCTYDHLEYPGTPIASWDIYADNPDFGLDAWQRGNHAGDLDDLTLEDVRAYMEKGIVLFQHNMVFSWDGYQVSVGLTTDAKAEQVWELLSALRER